MGQMRLKKERNRETGMKRKIVSILICLTMFVPCTAFGAQGVTDTQNGEGAAAVTQSGEEQAEEPAAGTQNGEEQAEEPAADLAEGNPMEDLLVVRDNRGRKTDLDAVDEGSYDGFLYVLKDDTSKQDIREMEENIEALNAGQLDDPAVEGSDSNAPVSDAPVTEEPATEGPTSDAPADGAQAPDAPADGAQVSDAPNIEEVATNEIYAADSLESIDAVADPQDIDYIEPNYIRQLASQPKEGSINNKNTQNYRMVGIDLLWDYGITGKGVKVGVLDSGVVGLKGGKVKHQDIPYKKITRGTTYAYSNLFTSARYKSTYGNDDNGHGSFVAGEIVAKKGNKKGVTGFAPGVKLISFKVSNKQGAIADSDCIKALKQAKKKGVKVVNMSIAGPNYSGSFKKACDKLASSGILLIASAGNHGSSIYEYPASYGSVISVGAVDQNAVKTSYSDYNDQIDCAAPGNFYGIGIKKKDKYRSMQGTSMAAPVVTAYAAIVKSLKPGCTVKEFRKILKNTSTDLGSSGKDNYYGYGLVNFRSMYAYLTGNKLYPKSGANVSSMYTSKVGTSYKYTGKAIRPSASIDYLSAGTDYTVEYQNNIEVGTASLIFHGTGKYTGTKKINYNIVPAPSDMTGVSAGKKSMTVTWEAQTVQTNGYQLRVIYYTKTSKKKQKYIRITINQTTSKKITKLKSGKTYYVQVRTYKSVDGKDYYSAWSPHYAYARVK